MSLNNLPSPDAKQALDDILRRINFRTEVFYRGQLCDQWALDTSSSGNVNFHIVCHGDCWLHMPGKNKPMHLHGGDVVVFPHDASHIIGSSENKPTAFGVQQIGREVPLEKSNPGTAIICGFIVIDPLARRLIMANLPEFMIIDGRSNTNTQSVRTLLELLFTEAKTNETGAAAILDRLSDALLFYLVRDLIQKSIFVPGLLGAFGDAQICQAVLAISDNPGEQWSIDKLAAIAFLSRSVFVDRFIQACGLPPIEFLTIWRMYLARRWLEQDHATVLDVAERCGYKSEAAFSKAFKRVMGAGPGHFRKLGGIRK